VGYFSSVTLFGLYTLTVLGALFSVPGTAIYYYLADILIPVKGGVLVALALNAVLLLREIAASRPLAEKAEQLVWSTISVAVFAYASFYALTNSLSGSAYWSLYENVGLELRLGVAIAFVYAFASVLVSRPRDTVAGLTRYPQFHERGRPLLQQKLSFFRSAKHEVIELGVSLRTLVGYFDQRPSHEFRKPVADLLRNGVSFRFILLDPDSEVAGKYAEDREEPELLETIRRSINVLKRLREEFRSAGLPGAFEIWVCSHFPYCYAMLVDPTEREGRMYVSHYLHGVKRADTPVIELYKSANPALFEKYHHFVLNFLATSKKL
jgi:hypothetical protein